MAIFKGSLKAIKEDWKSAVKYVIAGVVGFSIWMIIGFLLGQHKLPTSYPSGEYIEIAGSQWFFIGLLGPIGLFGGAFLGLPSKNPKKILKLALLGWIGFIVAFFLFIFIGAEFLLILISGPSLRIFNFSSVFEIWSLLALTTGGILGVVFGGVIGFFLGIVLKNKKKLAVWGGMGMLIETMRKITIPTPGWFEFSVPFIVLGAFLGLGIYLIDREQGEEEK